MSEPTPTSITDLPVADAAPVADPAPADVAPIEPAPVAPIEPAPLTLQQHVDAAVDALKAAIADRDATIAAQAAQLAAPAVDLSALDQLVAEVVAGPQHLAEPVGGTASAAAAPATAELPAEPGAGDFTVGPVA